MIRGKNAALVRMKINNMSRDNLESSDSPKPVALPPPEHLLKANSPQKKPSILVSEEMCMLVDDAFIIQREIPEHHLELVWEHFSEGEKYLCDENLERLIKEFIILGREAARRQITRQQKAVRHCTKKQKMARADTGIPKSGLDEAVEDIKDFESDIKRDIHEKFPAVGGRELPTVAGKTAVKCSQILARVQRGSSFLYELKQILYPESEDVHDVRIDQPHFMKYFPQLVYNLSSNTNLDKLKNLAPIRHASSGINLNWRPNSLPVGPVRVKCEFEFGEIEGVPETEDFNIPENTPLSVFIEHLIQIYPQIESGKEELEIQLVTAEAITCVDAKSDKILYSGVELLMMD